MRILENDQKTTRLQFGPERPDLAFIAYNRSKNVDYLRRLVADKKFSQHSNFLGSVIGLSLGDALGCATEGMSKDQIKRRYKEVNSLLYPGSWKNWRLGGLHSDDTQHLLVFLESIKEAGVNIQSPEIQSLENAAAAILKKFAQGGGHRIADHAFGCWRGTGKGFREVAKSAFTANDFSRPYHFTSKSAGIGAAMRIAPIGALFSGKSIGQVVTRLTLVTHSHKWGLSSAVMIALLAYLCCQGLSVDKICAQLLTGLERYAKYLDKITDKNDFIEGGQEPDLIVPLIKDLPEFLKQSDNDAMKAIEDRVHNITDKKIETLTGFGPSGAIACAFFALKYLKTPMTAIYATINAGGDTDTNAAIVGGIVGARNGIESFYEFMPDLVAMEYILTVARSVVDDTPYQGASVLQNERTLTSLEGTLKKTLELM